MSDQEYKEEIDLRDYINIIIKRKKLILIVFFVSVIVTAVVSFLMPQIYQSIAMIQNGVIDGPLVKKSEVEEMIKFYTFLNPITEELKLKTDIERLKKAIKVEEIKDTDFLRFKVEYRDKDASFKLCQSIVNSFLAQANHLYQQRLNLVNQRLEELSSQIRLIQSDIEHTQGLIQNLSISEKIDEIEAGIRIILLQNTLPNYQTNLISLLDQRNNLQLTLLKTKEFKPLNLTTLEKPIRPKKKQNIVISGIVSLILGTFLAFFMESWGRHKQT